jgi:hypothetical protein
VTSVYEMIEDYKKSRLGSIYDLPAPLVDGLRALELELSAWDSESSRQSGDSNGD